jgi:lipopolysaccharide biosynthesis glycosyltransferase
VAPLKTIVITAADETFSPHLRRLIRSLLQWETPVFDAIGVLDVGLSNATIHRIQDHVDYFADPGWDLSCDPALCKSKPYLRAKTARPFLPKYFPGFDIYVWLDADIWVQERHALQSFITAAQQGALGIVPQEDPSYVHSPASVEWRSRRLAAYFHDEATTLLASHPYYNGGAFSLRADAPHWNSWAQHFAAGLKTFPTMVSDQTALNFAVWKDRLPVHPLPASCNWCCHLARPIKDPASGKYCEPRPPHSPIGLVHMTASTKTIGRPQNAAPASRQ